MACRKVKMKKTSILLAFLALVANGCCLLPIPVLYEHGPSVEGTVLEQGTDRPISGAKVTILNSSYSGSLNERSACTDSDGRFSISNRDIHFGLWAASPSSGTCLPFAVRNPVAFLEYSLKIEAKEYEPFWHSEPSWNEPSMVPPDLSTNLIFRLRPLVR